MSADSVASIEMGVTGPRLVARGPWSPTVLSLLRESEATELELNYAKGWTGDTVAFLSEIEYLEALKIIDWTITDVSPINRMSSLRRLEVSTYCKTEIDFANFPRLECCVLQWRPKTRGLFEHARLRELFLFKYPGSDLGNFGKMQTLESLSLASAKLESLDGGTLPALQHLSIQDAPRLRSLSGLDALPRLASLEFNGCPGIASVEPIQACSQLRELHVIDVGEIESLSCLRQLEALEVLLFYGSTNVVDGDLGVLLELPRLRRVAFAERAHYSHDRTAFG